MQYMSVLSNCIKPLLILAHIIWLHLAAKNGNFDIKKAKSVMAQIWPHQMPHHTP
jgi:hypothetical protein